MSIDTSGMMPEIASVIAAALEVVSSAEITERPYVGGLEAALVGLDAAKPSIVCGWCSALVLSTDAIDHMSSCDKRAIGEAALVRDALGRLRVCRELFMPIVDAYRAFLLDANEDTALGIHEAVAAFGDEVIARGGLGQETT